jgi:hypothetical protein
MEVDNIEFNNVEYEVKSLIEFSSLARLLFDLAKRHKELEKKYEYINDSVQDKDQRISDLELKINGESRSYKKKFDGETISQKSKLFEGNNKTLTSNENNESKDEGLDSIHGNKVNTDLIAKLNKKVKEIERQLSDMMIPKIKNNEDNIKNNAKHLDNLNKNYEKINRQFM